MCKVEYFRLGLNLMGFFVGSNLLKFRTRVYSDPYDFLASWNPNDDHPCNWLGIQCVDGKVHML